MAAPICAVPAPRICCNGPTRSGKSSAIAAPKAETKPVFFDSRKGPGTKRCHGGEQHRTAFPKKHFPVTIHPRRRDAPPGHLPVTMMREPVVRVANTDISGCDCGVVWRDIPRASTGRCFEGRQGSSPQACTRTGGQAVGGQATSEAGTGRERGCRRRGTYLDRSVRYLGADTATLMKVCFAWRSWSYPKTNPPNCPSWR